MRATTSILDRAVDASTVTFEDTKVCVYGDNGTGKTSWACTFPKPLLLVSFEPLRSGGAESVRKVPGVKVLRLGVDFTKSSEAIRLAEELRDGKGCGYGTVVVDSATSYQDLFLSEIMGKLLPEQMAFGTVTKVQYQMRAEKIKEGLRPFLEIPAYVVVTAKERDQNPEKTEDVDMRPRYVKGVTESSWVGPALGGSSAGWLKDACSVIVRAYTAPGTRTETTYTEIAGSKTAQRVEVPLGYDVFRLLTKKVTPYQVRLRSDSPEKVPVYIEDPTFAKLMAVLNG